MLNSIKTPLLIASGVAATLTGFYFLGKDEEVKQPIQPKKKTYRRKKKTVVTKDKLIAFTKDFEEAVKNCRSDVAIQEQQILMNAHRQRIKVPPMELYQHLNQFFMKQLKAEEKKLYLKHNMDEKSTKDAAEKFKDDPEYIRLSKDINKQYSLITAPPSAKSGSSLELPKLKKFCSELLNANIQMWDEIEERLKTKKNLKQEEIIKIIQHKTQDATDALYEKFGIDKYGFEASIKKHMADREITQMLMKMQQVPQQRLRKLGLSTMPMMAPPK